jgi:hypothetical protein
MATICTIVHSVSSSVAGSAGELNASASRKEGARAGDGDTH